MITNYGELKAAIVDWSHRADMVAKTEEFIQLAEARIRNDLVLKPIETAVHGLMDGPILQPPADVEQLQKVMFYKNGGEFQIEYTSTLPIDPVNAVTGPPKYFTQQDQVLMLYPSPDSNYRYSIYYIPKLSPLSSTNPTNFLLLKSPDVYLSACLAYAAMWMKNQAEFERLIGLYGQVLAAARASAERYRMTLTSPMRMKVNSRRVV